MIFRQFSKTSELGIDHVRVVYNIYRQRQIVIIVIQILLVIGNTYRTTDRLLRYNNSYDII